MKYHRYKDSIIKVLEKNHLLNLAEIHTQVPDAHFASIYRNVEGLCNEGVLKKVIVDKNNVYYELASHNHGHFVCDSCDEVTEVPVPKSIQKNHQNLSEMTIRGTCKDCS